MFKNVDRWAVYQLHVSHKLCFFFQVKKLVYLYLVRYAEEQQDLALLSISTFQKGSKVCWLEALWSRDNNNLSINITVPEDFEHSVIGHYMKLLSCCSFANYIKHYFVATEKNSSYEWVAYDCLWLPLKWLTPRTADQAV